MLRCDASTRINLPRPPSKRLVHERPTDAAVGAGDQDRLIVDVHTVLPFSISVHLLITVARFGRIRRSSAGRYKRRVNTVELRPQAQTDTSRGFGECGTTQTSPLLNPRVG